MNQGDIILVRYPFSTHTDYKIRPALVVSRNEFNYLFDIWVCSITSKKKNHTISLDNSIIEGQLDKESHANPTNIATLNEELILKKIGELSKEKTRQIVEAIKKNF